MELVPQHHLDAFTVIGAKLMIGSIVPDQAAGAEARGFVLAHHPREFRVRVSACHVQLVAVADHALPVRLALCAVIARRGAAVTARFAAGIFGAFVDLDFALVSDEAVFAFAVIFGVVRLKVEVIVLFPELGDAGGALGSVPAVEGGNLGALGEVVFDEFGTDEGRVCLAYYKDGEQVL